MRPQPPPTAVREVLDVPYAGDGGPRHRLDLYLPGEPAGAAVVVVFHGGGLRDMSKQRMAGVCRRLAAAGFVAAAPNYRLLDDAPYPAQVEDALVAIGWVSAAPAQLAGAVAARPALLGASAGALLAQVAAARLGRQGVRCLVSISGPSHTEVLGLPAGRDNAVDLAGPDFPPALLTHSRADRIVPVDEACQLHRRLRELGVPAELLLYDGPGEDHAIWEPRIIPPVLLDFLEAKIHGFLIRWTAEE
jgi:acetyl esterase/lipase